MRRSTRLNSSRKPLEPSNDKDDDVKVVSEDYDNSDSEVDDDGPNLYIVDGVQYDTYQEMVNAKRRRNEQYLQESGLLSAAQEIKKKKKPSHRGISPSKKKQRLEPRRSSRRLAGIASDGLYVERESANRFTVATTDDGADVTKITDGLDENTSPKFYGGRINDGSDIMLSEAIENCEPKWQTSTLDAKEFFSKSWATSASMEKSSPRSVMDIRKQVDQLSADEENCVAKVVPGRIYSVAAHPSENQLIVAAGDKSGYVGLWDVNGRKQDDDGASVHLFRYHSGAVACLEWNETNHQLLSTSYDGTVRLFDAASEKSTQIFAAFDDSSAFADQLGAGLDTGYRFWTQYCCLDSRFSKCMFLSTSQGTVMHIDLRTKGFTFHEKLSEKKINTLSLHPNGHSLISAGLDCMVQLWDIRNLGYNRKSSHATARTKAPLAFYNGGKSVNSAFFSPSGRYAVSTTMNNKLDIFQDMHLKEGVSTKQKNISIKPFKSIAHDNRTGRWLSTFMARFHPSVDIFCVGSMKHPRQMEIFSAEEASLIGAVSGESLSAVASRCCFHPSTDTLTVVGGNSSGRVTILR